MMSERSRYRCLPALGVFTGLLALAAAPDKPAEVSAALPIPYATAVEAVRAVCSDGVIRGTAQYESETSVKGASESSSSASFPRWEGAGEVFYKSRAGAIAPSHFVGTRDKGALTVRYVVEPGEAGLARVTIDAVFVEDTHHGRHASQGFVERAELEEITKRLKSSGALGNGQAAEPTEPEVEPKNLKQAVQAPIRKRSIKPDRTAPAAAKVEFPTLGRTYPRAEDDLRKALQQLGAFDGAALPVLEGFATLDPDRLKGYDRPYYQFRVEFEPAGSGRTMLRIEAVVTARFTGPAGSPPEYRAVPSNGRLETDMFDRLDGYLRSQTGASAEGAPGFQQQASARSAGKK